MSILDYFKRRASRVVHVMLTLSCEFYTILILHDYLKTHAKIQINWRWFKRCCKSPKLTKKKGRFAKNCTKQNRMFVENDQNTLWNYCMRIICSILLSCSSFKVYFDHFQHIVWWVLVFSKLYAEYIYKVYSDHFQQTCDWFCTVFREWPLVFT
jgi:hypothetical protein